ncbi:hypothetical protein [Bacillus sp. B-jedd]|uniref:hypothetical protein n=1 Tax=Bacillus sp. B-jedd TaxID=1476857 RepID=UPI00051568A5|nr:hypothetical protein [Bacillus sp. B-jedd]CEG26261.1 membrane spanning protein [Bacillus sp. B-jedd]
MYFLNDISNDIQFTHLRFNRYSTSLKLVLGAIFAGLAAIFQSAGGFFPGVGYLASPLATAPILLCFIVSVWTGTLSYFLTCLLLLVLQPSELIVFPFTTGLLGFGLGLAFCFFKKRLAIILLGGVFLTVGIAALLYVFRFPVLGPAISLSFSIITLGGVFIFAFLYTWGWVEASIIFFKRFKNTIPW